MDATVTALTDTLTVLGVFLVLALPSLIGHVHERRVDRQLREAARKAPAETAAAPSPSGREPRRDLRQGPRRDQKSSSKPTVPSTATWYADTRRSKKLVSS
ncbi:hypothetical protein [Streptomyces minutiscleroticus]|nr:hypothetical protein [Streptomyces minutiscleroticus]